MPGIEGYYLTDVMSVGGFRMPKRLMPHNSLMQSDKFTTGFSANLWHNHVKIAGVTLRFTDSADNLGFLVRSFVFAFDRNEAEMAELLGIIAHTVTSATSFASMSCAKGTSSATIIFLNLLYDLWYCNEVAKQSPANGYVLLKGWNQPWFMSDSLLKEAPAMWQFCSAVAPKSVLVTQSPSKLEAALYKEAAETGNFLTSAAILKVQELNLSLSRGQVASFYMRPKQ